MVDLETVGHSQNSLDVIECLSTNRRDAAASSRALHGASDEKTAKLTA
jgi:hypothetical protein